MGSSLGLSDKGVKAQVCQKGQTTESEGMVVGLGGPLGRTRNDQSSLGLV